MEGGRGVTDLLQGGTAMQSVMCLQVSIAGLLGPSLQHTLQGLGYLVQVPISVTALPITASISGKPAVKFSPVVKQRGLRGDGSIIFNWKLSKLLHH